MKFVKSIASCLIICSIALMTSCRKDDITESGSTTTPTVSFRGGLAFKVKDSNGNPISGTTLSIALSQSELNSGTYLATRTTGSDGRADFGMLNAGNYYYRADVTINNIPYHGEGVVQVQASENLEQELTLQ
jgi:hypothetical protein